MIRFYSSLTIILLNIKDKILIFIKENIEIPEESLFVRGDESAIERGS